MIISFGGSVLVPESGTFDLNAVQNFLDVIRKIKEKSVVIVGGGATARDYVSSLPDNVKIRDDDKDYLGIYATILNARLFSLISGFKFLNPHVQTMKRVLRELKRLKYAVVSGWKPGFSTDYVAAYIAWKLKEDEMINITRVGGIFDKNPEKYLGARMIKRMTWQEYFERFAQPWLPGLHLPFDPVAAKICKLHRIKVYVTDVDGFAKWKVEGNFNGSVIF